MVGAAGKDKKPDPPASPTPGSNQGGGSGSSEILEEISLVGEPYGEVPTVKPAGARTREQPEIYEVEGEPLPYDTSLDYGG